MSSFLLIARIDIYEAAAICWISQDQMFNKQTLFPTSP